MSDYVLAHLAGARRAELMAQATGARLAARSRERHERAIRRWVITGRALVVARWLGPASLRAVFRNRP